MEDFGAQLPPEAQEYLKDIRTNVQQMGDLVSDLLAFSQLGRQPMKMRTIPMGTLVAQCFDSLRVMWDGRQVDFRLGELPHCPADPILLKQVWLNLLTNALKYTGKRNLPIIEIGYQAEDEGWTFFVRDNGVGFDMRYVDKLFGVFQRLHRAEDYEGTGVGLAIVQRIVHRHGGRVWAEAEPDKGAIFFFTLPKKGALSDE
jgi:light-regulated signal transduction histidine kinase (bacteriophytochrome)